MPKKIVYDGYVSISIPREVKERLDHTRKEKRIQGNEKYRLIDAAMDATAMFESVVFERK